MLLIRKIIPFYYNYNHTKTALKSTANLEYIILPSLILFAENASLHNKLLTKFCTLARIVDNYRKTSYAIHCRHFTTLFVKVFITKMSLNI